MLLKMCVLHGHTLAPEVAQLKIMRRHNRNRVRQGQPSDCLTRPDNAVGGVRPAKDLVNQNKHRLSALAVRHHLLDAQELGVDVEMPPARSSLIWIDV